MAKKQRAARGLAGVSIDTLHAELRRRQRGLRGLQSKYNKAAAKAARYAAEIEALGGSVGGGIGRGSTGRTRPKNELSLIDALANLLKGKEMSVTDAAGAVLNAGYRSNAANFRTIVNQALIKSNKFKKVSRGIYTAK